MKTVASTGILSVQYPMRRLKGRHLEGNDQHLVEEECPGYRKSQCIVDPVAGKSYEWGRNRSIARLPSQHCYHEMKCFDMANASGGRYVIDASRL